jgi:hypothetical protein
VRFNDLMATVLAARPDGEVSRSILWRQCVDLLAQFDIGGRSRIDSADLEQVGRTLLQIRPQVGLTQRLASVVELGSRLRSPRLVRLLLSDAPPVIVATMKRAQLPDEQWPTIIAEAGPLARSVLRQRDDLGAMAHAALQAFGAIDLSLVDQSEQPAEAALAPFVGPDLDPVADGDQIRRIVSRIEQFTSERQMRARPADADSDAGTQPVEPVAEGARAFSLITDAQGIVIASSGLPSAAFTGLSLASASQDRRAGADGQILGAFRRRGAFRNGRLTFLDGKAQGDWLVDGDPIFDPATGRFTGFRCFARRASALESAPRITADPSDVAARDQAEAAYSASMRQLVHELRTPLNGVMGFSEIIESQLLGPVSEVYRNMAQDIVTDVRALVDILDDLDYASRRDGSYGGEASSVVDLTAIMDEAIGTYAPPVNGVASIRLDETRSDAPVTMARPAAERMIMHLVRAVSSCASAESLDARVANDGEKVLVTIGRPAALGGLSADQIFDPAYDAAAEGEQAPVLGVGFAMRLVGRIARAAGGSLMVDDTAFMLRLPAAAEA